MRSVAILLAGPVLAFLFVMTDLWASRYADPGLPATASVNLERRKAQLADALSLVARFDTYFIDAHERPVDPGVAWSGHFEEWQPASYEWKKDPDDADVHVLRAEADFALVHRLLSAIDQEEGPWIVEGLEIGPSERGAKLVLWVRAPHQERTG